MLDKLDQSFEFRKATLDMRAYRQEVLSSNIANADTPNYKARDIDFASSLAGALRKMDGASHSGAVPLAMSQPVGVTSGVVLATTEPGHLAGRAKLTATGGATEDYGRLK